MSCTRDGFCLKDKDHSGGFGSSQNNPCIYIYILRGVNILQPALLTLVHHCQMPLKFVTLLWWCTVVEGMWQAVESSKGGDHSRFQVYSNHFAADNFPAHPKCSFARIDSIAALATLLLQSNQRDSCATIKTALRTTKWTTFVFPLLAQIQFSW